MLSYIKLICTFFQENIHRNQGLLIVCFIAISKFLKSSSEPNLIKVLCSLLLSFSKCKKLHLLNTQWQGECLQQGRHVEFVPLKQYLVLPKSKILRFSSRDYKPNHKGQSILFMAISMRISLLQLIQTFQLSQIGLSLTLKISCDKKPQKV